MTRYGLIAGNGRFPLLALESALTVWDGLELADVRAKGEPVKEEGASS